MRYTILLILLFLAQTATTALAQTNCLICNGNSNSTAPGSNALAIGSGSGANGAYSIVIGQQDTTVGDFSTTIGYNLHAIGNGSVVLGNSNTAIGSNGFSSGLNNLSYGNTSATIGANDTASGNYSLALGSFVRASGDNSIAMGTSAIAGNRYAIAVGKNVSSTAQNSITFGIGASGTQPLANSVTSSLMIGFNSVNPTFFVGPSSSATGVGNVGIGTSDPKSMLDVAGNIAVSGRTVINAAGQWLGDTTGLVGPPGQNGSLWYSGSNNPSDTVGNNTDLFLNSGTDSVFQKLNHTWQFVTNIQGKQGLPGSCSCADSAAQAAAQSADSAKASADRAQSSASSAASSAAAASASASSSSQSASAASSSASDASSSASSASHSSTAAGISATAAAGSALAAGGAATAAGTAATEASGAATEATGAATEASASAGEASTSATEASNSATEAGRSAQEASSSANEASASADTARYYADQAKNANLGGDLSGIPSNATVIGLRGKSISTATPQNGQVLQWNGGSWTPASPDTTSYYAGTGVTITNDTISALTRSALWNASAIQNRDIDTTSPALHQVLTWNGAHWSAQDTRSGWVIDSVSADTSNLYTAVLGNVGIGTKTPGSLFQVQGGSTGSTDSTFVVSRAGNVGIGTVTVDSAYKLSVNGEVRAVAITVESDWSDYVFSKEYRLPPLTDVERYVKSHHHLPGVPSQDEIKEHGLNLAQSQKIMMAKIEELTLYLVDLKKENERLQSELDAIKKHEGVR